MSENQPERDWRSDDEADLEVEEPYAPEPEGDTNDSGLDDASDWGADDD